MIKGAKMSSKDRKKISYILVEPKTHATMKTLAALQEVSLQGLAAQWLDEVEPVMDEMVQAIIAIKSGKDANKVLQNLMGKGLQMAGDQLTDDNEEDEDVTDNGQSD